MINNKLLDYNDKFKNKNILILGLGGIGANVAFYLLRAGFDTFTIVDCDKVEVSNLIRQYPYDVNDVGKFKTDALKSKMKHVNVQKRNIKILEEKDIEHEILLSDLVICTLDKPVRKIRRLINKLCVRNNKPVIFSGFSEHVAMIGPFIIPNQTACLLCMEKSMNETPLNNVNVVPSYGPLCNIIASIVTNEIINYFIGYSKNNLFGKTMMFDIITYQCDIIKWQKQNQCKVCGNNDSK